VADRRLRLVLYFDHVGQGLAAEEGTLKGFKICGEDNKFLNAEAEIKNNTVEVYCAVVSNPIAVRYGWANYAEINLYNKNGLPANPFRTDSF
jgi:sialate O-acetylesterase